MLFNIYGVIIGRGSFYSISEVVYVKKKKKKKRKKKKKKKRKGEVVAAPVMSDN